MMEETTNGAKGQKGRRIVFFGHRVQNRAFASLPLIAMPKRPPANSETPAIPLYSLYGQIDSAAELRFLHVESLAARNQLHNWDIRPHRHHDLHQILWVWQGAGAVVVDEKLLALKAPVLINLPASVVHGFQWGPGAEGTVMTIADSFKTDLSLLTGDAAIGAALREPLAIEDFGQGAVVERLMSAVQTIADEFVYERTGRTTTIAGYLLVVFAEIARLKQQGLRNVLAVHAKGGETFHRFRELVEAHFREHWAVSSYAAELAATERSLRRLTMKFANQSPIQIIHRRLVLEAKRNLLYTAMSIADVGYALGFEDPSYFTRFFIDHAGETPLHFRRSRVSASAPPDAGPERRREQL
jgi:AraC family transcriptional activator of pobA